MVEYNLDRFCILLVEDSAFIRSLLLNTLQLMGVGTVKTCEDGAQAIDFLKLVQNDPMKAGVQQVDIIISNWSMSPVDGMMLLRWVRRHKESPDRFIPFVMISGYSEPERVHEAREMGTNEFLTKPFTMAAVYQKVLSIIDRPRQFVHTASYFGPDRRRQAVPHKGAERRILTDKSPEVEVVRG